jgi:hypothetical protein
VFDGLAIALKDLGSVDTDTLTDAELADAVVELNHQHEVFEAARVRLVRAFDSRRVFAADGAKTAAVWLAVRTRAPKHECSRMVRRSRACDLLPVAAQAWAAGEVGGAHIDLLGGARNERTAELLARDEALLVDHARTLRFAEFKQAVDYWLVAADPDGCDADAIERRQRREVHLDETISGMYSGSILLDPVSGVIVATELDRLEQQLFNADWAGAKTRLDREPMLSELGRTSQQRRADALVEMANRSATMPQGGTRPKPLFTLVLGVDRLARLCQLATGQVLAPAAVAPWIDQAELETILFDGVGERAIKATRKRRFTGILRRILDVRDRQCTHPYCDQPAPRCQGDHIIPYSAGGPTSQDNGQLHCGHHNRTRHHQQQSRPPPDDP